MPYLYKTSIETSKSGIPTMRAMVLEFTGDKNCNYIDKQYMLGDSLLVAPIFNDESMAEYYLPKGIWTNFFTGESKRGGEWITEKHDYLSIPLMVRENSIIVMGAHDDRPDYDYADGAEVRIYALQEGKEASTVVYDMKQNVDLSVNVKNEDGKLSIHTKGTKPFTIRLVNVKAVSVNGGSVITEGNDTIITPESNEIEVNF